MYFYLVDKIGDGTRENEFRPNIPEGISYVCTGINNQFLVGTNDIIQNEIEITDLQAFCSYNDLVYDDVSKWFVGDTS